MNKGISLTEFSGKTAMFANTFTDGYDQAVATGKRTHTASTLSALAGGVRLRRVPDLLEGLAVYQDMTNEILVQQGEQVSVISSFGPVGIWGTWLYAMILRYMNSFRRMLKGIRQIQCPHYVSLISR